MTTVLAAACTVLHQVHLAGNQKKTTRNIHKKMALIAFKIKYSIMVQSTEPLKDGGPMSVDDVKRWAGSVVKKIPSLECTPSHVAEVFPGRVVFEMDLTSKQVADILLRPKGDRSHYIVFEHDPLERLADAVKTFDAESALLKERQEALDAAAGRSRTEDVVVLWDKKREIDNEFRAAVKAALGNYEKYEHLSAYDWMWSKFQPTELLPCIHVPGWGVERMYRMSPEACELLRSSREIVEGLLNRYDVEEGADHPDVVRFYATVAAAESALQRRAATLTELLIEEHNLCGEATTALGGL